MDLIAATQFKVQDEYYTPKILVDAILPYVPEDKIIWCPFDNEHSEFVIGLKENGNKVEYGHISEGKDFFEYEPLEYDMVISNPPFSLKLDILQRLYDLQKPFAMLFNLSILNYQEVGKFFLDKDLQLLIVDKKVSFTGKMPSFNTSYFCGGGMLPKDIIFTHLDNNNSNKYYIPSRMMGTVKENK